MERSCIIAGKESESPEGCFVWLKLDAYTLLFKLSPFIFFKQLYTKISEPSTKKKNNVELHGNHKLQNKKKT